MSEQTLDLTDDPTEPSPVVGRASESNVTDQSVTLAPSVKTEKVTAWVDVATVSVPLRTKRRGIIAKALLDAGIRPEPGKPAPRVRVLDEESAAVVEPEPFQPEAEWRV